MTLKELESDILALCFEAEPEDEAALAAAVNRALATIHTERDRIEELSIYRAKNEPVAFFARLLHRGGEEESLSIAGRAFSLTAFGSGTLIVRDADGERRIGFSGGRTAIREIVAPGGATLSFAGDYDYELCALAVFPRLRSPRPADIELYREAAEYDMSELDPRFIAFAAPICGADGREIAGAVGEGKLLKLPSDFRGEARVRYKRGFTPAVRGEAGAIDVARECEHLVAPLAAAYLLLDGDEELAEYYMALYRDGMAAVKLYNRRGTDCAYTDVLGWA